MMVVGLSGEIRRLSDNPFHIVVIHKVVGFNSFLRHNCFIEIKKELK
jgi:Holliday junction resolvasome RuvABC DNA-binding subunit